MKVGTLFVAVAALTLAACDGAGEGFSPSIEDQRDRSAPVTTPESVSLVATAEPGATRNRWKAQTELTRTVAGNLTASLDGGRGGVLVLAFANGITMRLERIADQVGADRTGTGNATFSAVLGADPNAQVFVYRVAEETVVRSAASGGLCKEARTNFVALSEFVNRQGDWVFTLASYRGAAAPGPQANGDPQFCAAYGYAVL